MAEYDMRPIEVPCTLQETYDLLKKYFLRETNPFNILTDYCSEDGFTIDIVRSYSFIASTFKASIHLAGYPQEEGGTVIRFRAKSVEEPAKLEKEVVDRIEEALTHMIAEQQHVPLPAVTPEEEAAAEKKRKKELLVIAVVAAVIILGTIPVSCSDTFSRLWMF